ncbi:MAG: hypothetical protein H2045_12145 [Rhizobiales bacterium]|nr:hypothetical protein [Hyphomicrobiales bacterium]
MDYEVKCSPKNTKNAIKSAEQLTFINTQSKTRLMHRYHTQTEPAPDRLHTQKNMANCSGEECKSTPYNLKPLSGDNLMTIKATTKALLGTAVSFALLGSAGTAYAADLDNLSDDDLLARIERLEKIIGPGDNYVLRTGGSKIRLEFSGQFHRTVLGFGDGEEFNVGVVDNTNLSSRVRWIASGKLNEDISVGGLFEFDNDSGTSSGSINQNLLNIGGGNVAGNFSTRHAAVWLESKKFGRITLGQTNTSSNGSTENDFSGTDIALYPSQLDFGGGILLRDQTGALTTATLGAFTGDFDGTNRDDVIRYDTPTFAGFKATGSYTNGGQYAVAVSYKNKDLAGFGISATVAYSDLGNQLIGGAITPDDADLISGSVAAIHLASGFNAAFAFGFAGEGFDGLSAGDSDGGSQLYGKLGWIGDLNSYGKTAFAVDASFNRDIANEGSNYRGFGVVANQTFDAISTDLYIGYRNSDVTDSGIVGTDFDAIQLIFAGARVKF